MSRPLEALATTSEDGVPFLAPEVQLYYKAKAPQPKDEEDLTAVLPMLTHGQRRWLLHAISTTYGRHSWADPLRD